MFERKIYPVKDTKKLNRYLIDKSFKSTIIFILCWAISLLLSSLLLYISNMKLELNIFNIFIPIILLCLLFVAFYFIYKKKSSFDMIRMDLEKIKICYNDHEIDYYFEEIFAKNKKNELILIQKNKKYQFIIPKVLLKQNDLRNILTDFKKYNVRIKR